MSGPELRDIHLPPDPGWWPPAPGWWLLALLLLAALAWCGLRLGRRLRQRRGLNRLRAEIDAALAGELTPAERLAQLSALLRRWARQHRPESVGLAGEAWLQVLDGDWPEAPFQRGPGRLLIEAAFQPQPSGEGLAALEQLVRRRLLEDVARA